MTNKSTNEEWLDKFKEEVEPSMITCLPDCDIEVIGILVKEAEEKGYQRGRKEKYKASNAYNQGYQRGSIERHTKDAENISLVVENIKKESYQQCKEEIMEWAKEMKHELGQMMNYEKTDRENFKEGYNEALKDLINHLKKKK